MIITGVNEQQFRVNKRQGFDQITNSYAIAEINYQELIIAHKFPGFSLKRSLKKNTAKKIYTSKPRRTRICKPDVF
jgi:hypothetical protein